MFQKFQKSSRLNLKGITSGSHCVYLLEDISISYGNVKALKNINLKIEKGEIVFITGASGAGKTTLLKLMAGEIVQNSGRVVISAADDKSVFVSQVFQDLRLLNNQTIYRNLLFSYDPKVYKNRKEFESELSELVSAFGIESLINSKVKDTNGGVKQKVGIIRALLSRPNVFVADEPTSSLDIQNAIQLFDILNIYNVKRKMTVIWASHNRELVQRFSGRILHLEKGKLVHSGHACFI